MLRLSVQEIKAVAETAISARYAADAAKQAHEAAPDDASLKDAYDAAEQKATEAKTKADALSQDSKMTPDAIAKAKRKVAMIQNDLRLAGALEDDDDLDVDDDMDDPNRPVTFGDLQRIEAQKGTQSARQMADTIEDPIAKQAVIDALARIVPSGDPQKDLTDAVTIANRERNSKVLEEFGRRVVVPQHRSGAGSPPARDDGEFVPSTEELGFMRAPFKLDKKAILEIRKQAEAQKK